MEEDVGALLAEASAEASAAASAVWRRGPREVIKNDPHRNDPRWIIARYLTLVERGRKPLKAADVMSREVVVVRPDTPARAIATLLFKRGISAVPVVDEGGSPIGMVSEGDLMPRDESEREARRDWWLRMLAEGEELSPVFVSHVESQDRTARQIMSAPVITIPDTADLVEVAEVLSMHRIKRAPVLHEGRLVGISAAPIS
jgi:CBS domain-containing protein